MNEIGRYSGEMTIRHRHTFIEISGDGAWTLTKI